MVGAAVVGGAAAPLDRFFLKTKGSLLLCLVTDPPLFITPTTKRRWRCETEMDVSALSGPV